MPKAKRSRRKRNARIPPPGWEVACQWYAWASDETAKRTGVSHALEEAFETREEAVLAAWDEHDEDLEA